MRIPQRAGLAAATVAMIALAACSNKTQPADASLKADLAAATGASVAGNASVDGDIQLAPTAQQSQTVVSAIEGGPTSAPKRASVKPVSHTPRPKPQPKPQTSVAQLPPAPAPVPQPEVTPPAPSEPQATIPAPRPQPLPAQQPQQRQRGTYATEAQIFKQMPWIRP